jgi:TPR repeat protein
MKALLLAFLILVLDTPVSAGYDEAWLAYLNQDYEAALKELKPLAEQGDARSQYAIGWMYRNGEGVAQDYKAASNWYRLAAEQGHAEAQKSLGLMYQFGEGIAPNYQSATKWYRLAAQQGNAEAQNNLGLMYLNGEGVTQSKTSAYMWLYNAASQGVSLAKWSQHELEKKMTPEQVKKAQAMAQQCLAKKYKNC